MDAAMFRTRIAPLLDPDTLRALRLANRSWQWVVDELILVKGALGLRKEDTLTMADVRYARAHGMVSSRPVDWASYLRVCAGGELADLRWALQTFGAYVPRPQWLLHRDTYCYATWPHRVSRVECMEVLVQECSLDPRAALLGSCLGGRLAVVQWLVATFQLEANAECSCGIGTHGLFTHALWLTCDGGHLALAQWLVGAFNLTAEDVRSMDNHCFRWSCKRGHLAMAQWLVDTFNLTATDARARNSSALAESCEDGHLEVAQWLVATFCLTADDVRFYRPWSADDALRASCRNGHLAVAQWLVSTFSLTMKDPNYSHDLRGTREKKHYATADWMVKTFGTTDQQQQS
jgi:hypothetical protein